MIQIFFFLLPIFLRPQNFEQTNPGSSKAVEFLNTLSEEQRRKAIFPFDDMNRYEWHYLPASMVSRNGISVRDLNEKQKQNLYSLLKVYLSQRGFDRTRNIMEFENILKELQPGNSTRIPGDYYVAIYGNPGKDSTWGWKYSGHHIALNFTIVNGNLAFAPFFFGVYPAEVKEGPRKGMRIIKDEEDLGFELINSLNPEQKKKAVFRENAFGDIVTTVEKEISPLQPAGITGKDLKDEQKTVLNKLIVSYLLSMPSPVANARMEKIAAEDINTISFGWAGGTVPGNPHYYRVQGKSFLIEFDNTQNNANHIHSVWRDFNGDFGRDMLREHYQSSHHH